MTKRAKIAAEHRDAVANTEVIAELPSTGRVKARKERRPWIVEYCAKKNTEKQWFTFRHDGQWHQYGAGYSTQRGAESAMRSFRYQDESLTKLSKGTFARNLAWRVRNVEEPPREEGDR